MVVKQYNYRSPTQAHRRAIQRRDDQGQINHYQHLINNSNSFFTESLAADHRLWAARVPVGEGEATKTEVRPLPILRQRSFAKWILSWPWGMRPRGS